MTCAAKDTGNSGRTEFKDSVFRNPVLFSDYSDPDAICVDGEYWMTASSFNCVPGLQILHSTDLIHWEIVGAALPEGIASYSGISLSAISGETVHSGQHPTLSVEASSASSHSQSRREAPSAVIPFNPALSRFPYSSWDAAPVEYGQGALATPARIPHGDGVWAPAIRFRESDRQFYIFWGDPDRGIYQVHTKDPRGAWSTPVLVLEGKGLIDPCPLFDDDGRVFLVHGWARSRAGIKSILSACELNSDATACISGQVMVFDGRATGNPTVEGPKFYKKDGRYYIFAPAGGVKTGWQIVLRADSPYGPYEWRRVMEESVDAVGSGTMVAGVSESRKATGASAANGDSSASVYVHGPHQGAWVQDASGSSWFLHFEDRYAWGRVIHLQPMAWSRDGWCIIGKDIDDDGIGEPVLECSLPATGSAAGKASFSAQSSAAVPTASVAVSASALDSAAGAASTSASTQTAVSASAQTAVSASAPAAVSAQAHTAISASTPTAVSALAVDSAAASSSVSAATQAAWPKTAAVDALETKCGFDGNVIPLNWQWADTPDAGWFTLCPELGALRINCQPQVCGFRNLWDCPQMLLEKVVGPSMELTATMEFHPSHKGDRVGMVVMGTSYSTIELYFDGNDVFLQRGVCTDAEHGSNETVLESIKVNGADFVGRSVPEMASGVEPDFSTGREPGLAPGNLKKSSFDIEPTSLSCQNGDVVPKYTSENGKTSDVQDMVSHATISVTFRIQISGHVGAASSSSESESAWPPKVYAEFSCLSVGSDSFVMFPSTSASTDQCITYSRIDDAISSSYGIVTGYEAPANHSSASQSFRVIGQEFEASAGKWIGAKVGFFATSESADGGYVYIK